VSKGNLSRSSMRMLKIKWKTLKKYWIQQQRGKKINFEKGDWVWLYLRKGIFSSQRKSKLSPRGDGLFQILKKLMIMDMD